MPSQTDQLLLSMQSPRIGRFVLKKGGGEVEIQIIKRINLNFYCIFGAIHLGGTISGHGSCC